MKRIQYIDYTKGFVILLMLFAHTGINQAVNIWIFSFHMHIFFVVGGILLQRRYDDGRISGNEFMKMLKRRLRQIGVPYLAFSAVLALYYIGLNFLSGQPLQIGYYLTRILCLQGIDSLWFLPCFFFAELLMLATMTGKNGKWIVGAIVVVTVAFLVIFPDRVPAVHWQRLLLKVCICFVFVSFGRMIEQVKLIERIPVFWGWVLLGIGAIFSQVNGFSAIGSLEIGSGILFFLDAAMTSLAIMRLFFAAERSAEFKGEWLGYIGRNTIVILCTNNLLIEIVRLLDHRFTGDILLRMGAAGNVVFFGLLLGMELCLIRVFGGRLKMLVGKA